MAINREQRSLELQGFGRGGAIPSLPKPPPKPLDVHVARAAANALKLNVVNLNFEVRELVIAQGIQFHNNDIERKIRFLAQTDPSLVGVEEEDSIPAGLAAEFPDLVIQGGDKAVFISDAQRVEYRISVIRTKDAFKTALETPGIHVIYEGHARWGRGPCFGPDLPQDPTQKNGQVLIGEDWENGNDPVKFGLFRMGHPFVGLPFIELDDHKYRMRPVPTSVRINPADMDRAIANPNSLRPIKLRGSRFEPFIIDPVVDAYWGCDTIEGPGVVLFADFKNSAAQPFDLGATDIKCRCFSNFGCETFDHFHQILRKRKGHTRTETEGFAYFTSDLGNQSFPRLWIGSLFDFPERNDFKSWFPSLEFAKTRTNQKLAAIPDKCRIV